MREFIHEILVNLSDGKDRSQSTHSSLQAYRLSIYQSGGIFSLQYYRLPMPPNGEPKLHFDSIEDTIAAFRNGEFIVVLDSTDRENEGDLIIAAEEVTTEKMAFMIRHTRSGCLPRSRCRRY